MSINLSEDYTTRGRKYNVLTGINNVHFESEDFLVEQENIIDQNQVYKVYGYQYDADGLLTVIRIEDAH